jgi:hypothetical protein
MTALRMIVLCLILSTVAVFRSSTSGGTPTPFHGCECQH